MIRNLSILVLAAVVVALPLALRPPAEVANWRPGDPELVIASPHNEAIRYEFERAFSAWHERTHGRPVRINWRNIGGTTEISRYLTAEFVAAMRAWWRGQGKPWPAGANEIVVDRKFNTKESPPEMDARRWRQLRDLYQAFRATDNPQAFSSQIDLFFGGGEYDHRMANQQGLTVPPWPAGEEPAGLFADPEGRALIPESVGGETWRTPYLFGAVVSTFGICYNHDRRRELGVASPPRQWVDLTDPAYIGQVGIADPTKSGSIAKAFEMIIQQQCQLAVREAGFTADQVDEFEKSPATAPSPYPEAINLGWLNGIRLVQRIGANARYFTDSASKVPIDVSLGDAAAGLAIDFYGRFQAEVSRAPDGTERMVYLTPTGGSSVSCDPISLLRGGPHRDVAVRFIEFVLSEDGQRLWTYRPGTPGGPHKYALRRLPIRRDFYPSAIPEFQAAHRRHRQYAADELADPGVNPYALAGSFTYRPRWTAGHFNVHRDLVKAMCLDSGEELRAAWRAILTGGGPAAQPAAMAALGRMPDRPEPLTWESAPQIARKFDRLEYLREWTEFFRSSYREARALAGAASTGAVERSRRLGGETLSSRLAEPIQTGVR